MERLRLPANPYAWEALLRKALAVTVKQNHRMQHGMRQALVDGKAQEFCRKHSLISEADIQREFPPK